MNIINNNPPVPTVYTVREKRLATDLFGDDVQTCMGKTHSELDSDFKIYSDLTQAQCQICITTGVKKYIKAFLQCVRDE